MGISESASRQPLPDAFRSQMEGLLGSEAKVFEESLSKPSPTCIRFNPWKASPPLNGKSVPWCAEAIYLEERPEFVYDPLWHSGQYYVQEAASMFTGYVLTQLLPEMEDPVVLDLCAAPGGKSSHLASILYGKGLLVSNEVIRHRLHILRENLTKWGLPNTVITHQEAHRFSKLEHFFDVIVVDAPCSGEGLFRKQPEAMQEWSENQVEFCALRQKKIVEEILPSLKPGGFLIYSTCTYNKLENEQVLESICNQQDVKLVPISIPKGWGIVTDPTSTTFRFFPHLTQTEGFFLAVLQKKEVPFSKKPIYVKRKYFSWPSKEIKENFSQWFQLENMVMKQQPNGLLNLLPEYFMEKIDFLAEWMNVVQAGTEIAEVKGRDLNPTQAAANSTLLHTAFFPNIEVDLTDALAYLSKHDFQCEGQLGLNLITYQGKGLGWVKKMSNRINNYYPQEWRIRQTKK